MKQGKPQGKRSSNAPSAFEEGAFQSLARVARIGRRGFLSALGKGCALLAGILAEVMPRSLPGSSRQISSTPPTAADEGVSPRRRRLVDQDWRFTRGDSPGDTTSLLYAQRPQPGAGRGGRGAPPPQPSPEPTGPVAKPWILPTANDFLKDPLRRARRPEGNLGDDVAYVAADFDDGSWRRVNVPHDYAIEGPFSSEGGGGMGRLPSAGVVWYRKSLDIPSSSRSKSLFLDIDGAMAYSEVWLNGRFVGGWPYGYASFRLDLTPYVRPGEGNILAIRLDNPPASSRWYPGGGLYRNVWLVETSPVHVGQWGTFITTPEVSPESATVNLTITIDNDSGADRNVTVETRIYGLDGNDQRAGTAVAVHDPIDLTIDAGTSGTAEARTVIEAPRLWGTGPNQQPNRYVAVTSILQDGVTVDVYQTPFGIRSLRFDPEAGFFLNGEHIRIQGVCLHHDLGALGTAIHRRALERQFGMLADMGCNAIRTSHNPPAPELLDLADKMGFLIMDEAFDQWARQKTPLDYHLLYPDWHEQDLRSMIRRDRNHPSVILWSIGNEVGEQTGGPDGAGMARELTEICHEEDPTRPTISGMNSASATSPFPVPIDSVGLNYQGAGLFQRGTAQYPVFHESFPEKFIVGSETAASLSSRGVYTFPVAPAPGTPASVDAGEEPDNRQVSSYDMYFAPWAYTPEKEFAAAEHYPFVGGEFVWTGWDYLGEPTPFNASRSSYYGIVDLAGFRKDRFYLYQSHWRPDYPMAHILPHWTWPDRAGEVTPVHVYTSGDEAELFLNGQSLGRKAKGPSEYRLRWDDVVYEPGELRVVAYKDGRTWANDSVDTTGEASGLLLTPDRGAIAGDGKDLSFVTVTVADDEGRMVPRSMNPLHFEVSGPGEIVATDNGDPTDMTPFPSHDRKAFNGLALVIVRARRGRSGSVRLTATAEGLREARTTIAVV